MIIGIDLGTTNSAVAVYRDGAPELIPNRLGHFLTPSAVSVDEQGGIITGLAARERMASHPDHSVTAFKRYMGTRRQVRLGRKNYTPEELSALVLRSLKEDAEAFLDQEVTEAVITVPAYFNDKQRKATRYAGELAGLKVERLINEPTAAALAYGIEQLADESSFLVFDLGGGTFDVSIVEIFEGVIEVRASTGDNHLGGEDFNELLVGLMRSAHGAAFGAAGQGDDPLHQKLREAAERARRTLSSGAEADMRVVWEGQEYRHLITTAMFEEAAIPLINRLREPVLRSMRDSGVKSADLNEIILIGGCTRMPLVRSAVTRMFGRFPNATVNPDEAVALGAAVQAGLKSRDSALKEIVVTDVCPFSLGVDTSRRLPGGAFEHGIFAPIIERGTVIPASRMHVFATLDDNQPHVVFNRYQGESRRVRDNVELGQTKVAVPRGPAGQAVEVRFSYDISGLLEVDILVPESGETVRLTINDGPGRDPDALEKARKALAALKVHPRATAENKAALARGEKCFENHLGDQRAWVGDLIGRFNAVLERQDPRAIDAARKEFHDALDGLEGETYL